MQQQVKGFRPGKEPKKLRQRAVKQQFGDMTRTQERMVDLFSDRTPDEARALLGRWRLWSLIAAVVLVALTVLAWSWSWIAGVPVGLLAGGATFAHVRLRLQRSQLEEMAETIAKVGGRR